MSAPALEARGLIRHFGALVATDDVSFAGSAPRKRYWRSRGKTTPTPNFLTGVLKLTAGQVLLHGREVMHLTSSVRVRGAIATFQINQLFPI